MLFELVIPCYNESRSLPAMIGRTVQAAQAAGFDAGRFQLIIVDNGSTDATQQVLKEQEQGPFSTWFRVVRVTHNRGYGDGIWQGLSAGTASYLGWTHADEQCDPKDAFTALTKLLACPDPARTIVKGRRTMRRPLDYLWSRFFELAAMILLRCRLWEINAQPKVFSRSLLGLLSNPPHDFAFDLYALYKARRAGWFFYSVPVIFAPRAHGVSHWAASFKGRYTTALKMLNYIWRLSRQSG